MKYAADLHIHSALSPCADKDMTPNNIVNMAWIKGLDIISVTDHNSMENLPAILECAGKRGIVAVPGLEVETKEEVHVLCYLPGLEEARKVQEAVFASMPQIENRPDIFGSQLIMDSSDQVIGELKRMLLTASGLSVRELYELVINLGGIAVPAHINRNSYSILSNLGMIPQDIPFTSLEVNAEDFGRFDLNSIHPNHSYRIIYSSDSHSLENILERTFFLDLPELDCREVINLLSLPLS